MPSRIWRSASVGAWAQKRRAEIAVLPRRPFPDQGLQVADQLRRHGMQIVHAARRFHVVGHRAGAGAVGAQVLAPQQKLDGVVAEADVFLAALFVERQKVRLRNRRLGIVDDAGARVALHVVDVTLIHRPGVELALRPVGVVDGAAVESERFGFAVGDAGPLPGVLGGFERRGARPVGQRLQGALQGDGPFVGILVAGVHDVGVMRHHLLHRGGVGAFCRRPGQQDGNASGESEGACSHGWVLLQTGIGRCATFPIMIVTINFKSTIK